MIIRRSAVVISTIATLFGLTLTGCAVGDSGPHTVATTPGPTSAAAPANHTTPLALAMSPDITWKTWHGARLPFTDLWGPQHVNGDVATGFGHTPEGAVLAMMQQQLRLTGLNGAAWLAAARQLAVVAPADTTPTARVRTGVPTDGDTLPLVAGFHWISYTPTRAVSDLALQTAAGTLSALRVTEVWKDGDWRTELPAEGGTPRPLDGLSDYQPWPGTPR